MQVPPKALKFNGTTTEYGISFGSPALLTAISACFRVNVPSEEVSGQRRLAMLSYAVPGACNELFVYMKEKNLTLYVQRVLMPDHKKLMAYVVK